ncbi:cytochrome c peroxidase [Oxalobacteraceae bacterium GrIS 2.11]
MRMTKPMNLVKKICGQRKYVVALLICCLLTGTYAVSTVSKACSGTDLMTVGAEMYFPMAYGDRPTPAQLMTLGRKIFNDAGLSSNGKMSCATCHSPANAYGPTNNLAVQPGGPGMTSMGFRNTPSLRYLHSPINFTEHFYEPEVTGGKDDQGPTGGRTWDGRVNSGHDQALMPLMDRNEMANSSTTEIAERLSKSNYAKEFSEIVSAPGENVFDNTDAAVGWMTVAIEMFEQSEEDFHPFTSKFDAYLQDQANFTPSEKRGLDLFNDIKKGNCASCHTDTHKSVASHLPVFTDFGFVALAVPRNPAIPANANPAFFDLGLCGPLRIDLRDRAEYCGLFRTPTLRNVALRKSYFHNGAMHSLHKVVEFYVNRDITPEKWYSRAADGKVNLYDDLPVQYRKNVNVEAPFAPLPGNKPRLNASEINDVVAFLNTLSDGYTVQRSANK